MASLGSRTVRALMKGANDGQKRSVVADLEKSVSVGRDPNGQKLAANSDMGEEVFRLATARMHKPPSRGDVKMLKKYLKRYEAGDEKALAKLDAFAAKNYGNADWYMVEDLLQKYLV